VKFNLSNELWKNAYFYGNFWGYFPNNSSGFSLKSVKILELQFYLKQKESKIIFIYSLPRAAADGMCAAWYFACW
jgi:hypothetical protein